MPYFRLSKLSRAFLEVVADQPLLKLIDPQTSVYKLTVLSSGTRARTLLFLATVQGASRKRQIVSPDWWTSEFDQSLADELKIPQTASVCVFDSQDDHFHPTEVTPLVSKRFTRPGGVIGWLDLRDQFELNGFTQDGNIVLFAVEGAKCRSRAVHAEELPN